MACSGLGYLWWVMAVCYGGGFRLMGYGGVFWRWILVAGVGDGSWWCVLVVGSFGGFRGGS